MQGPKRETGESGRLALEAARGIIQTVASPEDPRFYEVVRTEAIYLEYMLSYSNTKAFDSEKAKTFKASADEAISLLTDCTASISFEPTNPGITIPRILKALLKLARLV